MAHTNSTQNYNLPQWIGSDKPTFLGDFNNAFTEIDSQLKVNSDSILQNADSTSAVKTLATTNRDNISALVERVTDAEADIVEANSNISANSTSINGITDTLASMNTLIQGKQNLITGAGSTITTTNLTANKVLVSDSQGKVSNSSVSATELGYLSGVTSNVQTQINKLKNWTKVLDITLTNSDTTYSYTNSANISNADEILVVALNGNAELLNSIVFSHNMLGDTKLAKISLHDVSDGIDGLALVNVHATNCVARKFNTDFGIMLRIYVR